MQRPQLNTLTPAERLATAVADASQRRLKQRQVEAERLNVDLEDVPERPIKKKRAPRQPDSPRRYDWRGHPVTGQVWATQHKSHSQEWSVRSASYQTTNRIDDLELMRARLNRPLTHRAGLLHWHIHDGQAIACREAD